MYKKRIKILIGLLVTAGLICIFSLAKKQLMSGSYYLEKVNELKLQRGQSRQLKTVRGKILDRKNRILAQDKPKFELTINYDLTRFADERVKKAILLNANLSEKPQQQIENTKKLISESNDKLKNIIQKCVTLGAKKENIEYQIKKINDSIWISRQFQAWRRNFLDENILKKYNNNVNAIPASVAFENFKIKEPNENQRLLLTCKVKDIAKMKKKWPIIELKTDDDVFTAQLEFMDLHDIEINAISNRYYPYKSIACHTIGWLGPANAEQEKLFQKDRFLKYLDNDLCGRDDGVEYVCETILRGKRGEQIYDIDKNLKKLTQSTFGKDVTLTLDIELQKDIENLFKNKKLNPNYNTGLAAVVIDVNSDEILAMVSLPGYDINKIRYQYNSLVNDTSEPLKNRAINKQYPPGSVIKPVILITGIETGKINSNDIISCPAHKADKGFPNCWIFKNYHIGHDDKWYQQGGNNAKNALKGSCNVYFSKLANRLDTKQLQKWLFDFGYGRKILYPPAEIKNSPYKRNIRNLTGQIASTNTQNKISDLNDIPPLKDGDKRWFGIGQGNLRVTPLQIANAMATLARNGLYENPKLFIEKYNNYKTKNLNISKTALNAVFDGMKAVVNETGGTAHTQFAHANFDAKGITVYGKTGSTEAPSNALFAGFAKDQHKNSIAISVLVEGGQHGSSDAAPLARDIIDLCFEHGYIGQNQKQ